MQMTTDDKNVEVKRESIDLHTGWEFSEYSMQMSVKCGGFVNETIFKFEENRPRN
jgi:hypothetical protein